MWAVEITRWRTAGLSVEIIAEKLGRYRSTIVREVGRNIRAKLRKPVHFPGIRQDAHLIEIFNRMTATPCKCIGYRTPAEAFPKKLLALIRLAG